MTKQHVPEGQEGTPLPSVTPSIEEIPVYSKAKGLGDVTWVASSNESPVAPAPGVVEAISRAAAEVNRYPSMFGDELTEALASRYKLTTDHIAVGAGSLSLLQQALSAFTGAGSEVVYAWRSYEAYPIAIRVAEAEPVPVSLNADFEHDLSAMRDAITERTRAVIICNPNNPTGTVLPFEEITAFLDSVPGHILVILDEAYREFHQTDGDGFDLIGGYPNVMTMRTFSKAYGLAGIRAGYVAADPRLVAGLRKAQPPFGLSRLAQAAALAALEDSSHMEHIISTITTDRDALITALRERGLHIPDSSSNFVWIPTQLHAESLVAACLRQGVAVRAFSGEGVRITAGEEDASKAAITAVEKVIPDLLAEGR